jgi:hypothetical protein
LAETGPGDPSSASADNFIIQIAPVRIARNDKVDLPLPRPVLDVLLTLKRCFYRRVLFEFADADAIGG